MRISDWSSDVCSSDLWWDEAQARWQSYDSVDFEPDKRPDYRPDWRKKPVGMAALRGDEPFIMMPDGRGAIFRSEEHTSELQSLMRISYTVFCLKKKTTSMIVQSPEI